MTVDGGSGRERTPRRARYLIPKGTSRRAQFVAGLCTLLFLAHLLLAPLTGLIAVLTNLVTRVSRWRWSWLWVPVAAGAGCVLAVGPAAALDGFLAGPRLLRDVLVDLGTAPERVGAPDGVLVELGRRLPGQLPIALILGAAEAVVAAWLRRLHTDEWLVGEPRPGLIVLARRWSATRSLRSGGVVTKDGAAIGVSVRTGRRAGLSWQEAASGVLVSGGPGAGKSTTSFQLVHAAIRRRKSVVAVDLAGSPELIARTRAACAATGTPFRLFTANGPGWYEPFGSGDAAHRAALITGMVDWSGIGEQYRRTCTGYLQDLLSVVDAAPGEARTSTLDEVVHLLNPQALRARAECIPDYQARRSTLIERAQVSAGAVTADPQSTARLHAQLTELHASAIGRRLRPDPYATGSGEHDIDLGTVIRERGVVLFSLDTAAQGRCAATVAGLIAREVLELGAELRRIGVAGDGLVWLDEFEPIGVEPVADLAARGRHAGLPVLLSTSTTPADRLLDVVGVHLVHRIGDPALARRFASMTGERLVPGEPDPAAADAPGRPAGIGYTRQPMVPADDLADRAPGEFTLIVSAPRRRVVSLARTVPARIGPAVAPAGEGHGTAGDRSALPRPPGAAEPDDPVGAPAAPVLPATVRGAPRADIDDPPMPPSAERRSEPTPPGHPGRTPGQHRRT